jgi:hypothetical protein
MGQVRDNFRDVMLVIISCVLTSLLTYGIYLIQSSDAEERAYNQKVIEELKAIRADFTEATIILSVLSERVDNIDRRVGKLEDEKDRNK